MSRAFLVRIARPFRASFRVGTLALALASLLAATAGAATYYVDNQNPAATDAGPGTQATPYRTISAAVAQHGGPGTEILVSPGVYREQVSVSPSGAAGSPFVLRATGPGVVVDGADDFGSAGLWAAYAGSVWLAAGVTADPVQVFVDGARLPRSAAAPASLPANSFTWVTGEGLYVNLGGDNPGTHQTLVGSRNFGFTMFTKSWITIEGFVVRHASDRGIFLQARCTNVTVAHNTVEFSATYGIEAVGGSDLLIDSNVVSDNGNHGIGLITGATHCTVRDNESFRNVNPAVRAANGIYVFGSPGNQLRGNRLHHNQDTGLHLGGGSNDCVFTNNASWSNGDHGFDDLNSSGAIHIDDVAYGNFRDGFSFEGTAPNGQLYNCISANNGLTTNGRDLFVDATSAPGFVSDFNILWNETGVPPIRFAGVFYATVAAFASASGNETHGIQADPMFVNPAGADFHLQAGSPAIDAATSVPADWPALDVAGQARFDDPTTTNHGAGPVTYADIGAFEFNGGGTGADRAPVVTAPASVTVTEAVTVLVHVTATDPDGDPITSLTANLSGLPPGNNATFTTNASYTDGTLQWTPTYSDAGDYTVTFTASNNLSGTATTTIHVLNVDRPPVVTAPANVFVSQGGTVRFTVRAIDPDGDAIQSLTMVPFHMPPNSGAVFTPNGDNSGGTFSWSVNGFSGNFRVIFSASNALTGTAATNIHVRASKTLAADPATAESGVEEPPVTELALSNAFPNPSRDAVSFDLELPAASRVQWYVVDLQGRAVWSEDRVCAAGRLQLRWNGMIANGGRAATGVYLARVRVGDVELTRRLIRL